MTKTYVQCKCGKRIFSGHTTKYVTEFRFKRFLFFWKRIVETHVCWNCWN